MFPKSLEFIILNLLLLALHYYAIKKKKIFYLHFCQRFFSQKLFFINFRGNLVFKGRICYNHTLYLLSLNSFR